MDQSQTKHLQQLLQLGDVTYIKLSKENTIATFEALDADTLSYLLDDSRTYQDATKSIFIEKVSEVFEEFRRAGDSDVKAYPGKCCSGTCPNLGCTGYSFIGRNSLDHLDLIFEEKDGQVTDIYNCSDFLIEDEIAVGRTLEIDIKQDEQAVFQPGVEYLINSNKCREAIADLLPNSGNIILKSDGLYWLDKYREFKESLGSLPFHYNAYFKFYKLYSSVQSFFDWIPYEADLETAMAGFSNLLLKNEKVLIEWLVAHEDLWHKVIGRAFDFDEDNNKLELMCVAEVPELFIDASECTAVMDFLETYQKHYWPLFKKYRIDNEEDLIGIQMTGEQFRERHSLTWHLKQRGLL